MEKEKKLISLKPSDLEIADLTTRALASFAAGIPVAYEPISFLLTAGAFFTSQSIVKMGVEVQTFLKSKKAKKESECALPHRKLYETLKFLHNSPTLDDDFLEALRNLHILTFAEDTLSEEVAELYILLETARKLSGPEISILLAVYRIHKGLYSPEKMEKIRDIVRGNLNINLAGLWIKMIAEACGYSLLEFVESRESHLEELRLITQRTYDEHEIDSRSEFFNPNGKSRLTDFGCTLAEYITKGETLFNNL